MVDFRRWIIVAAVLALFAGLASAQVPGGNVGSLACSASVAVPPQLRTEGLTELIGDIVLTCTGGAPLPSGSTVPTANITVSLGTNVTSRILSTGSLNGGPTQAISEALLLIDEPGSGIPLPANETGLSIGGQGIGPAAGQNACLNAAGTFPIVGAGPGGCPQTVNNLVVPGTGGGTIPVMSGGANIPPANMYLGLVTANQVTFSGIPILPPVTAGAARVFRMTNIRANVNGLGGGLLNGITQLVASVAISGSTALPVNNPVIVAGFIQPGLTTSVSAVSPAHSFLQCISETTTATALLKFSENFGTAFKTRVAPIGVNTTGQTGTPTALQNIPGTIYNSESGFVIPIQTFGINVGGFVNSATIAQVGLADYGTRLKAVFNNIPAGVRLFVSVTNLSNLTAANTVQPAGNSATSFALLVNGETTPDGNGTVPQLGPSVGVNGNATGITEVLQNNGSATAVWEVINTNPAASETFSFGVWTTYVANQAQGVPAVGTITVNQSYAPTPGPATFTASAGASASGTLTIPRFADTSTARTLLTINLCQTLLLFPFITNQNGFDTGLAISNTTTDPIGTPPQNGICKLNYYDGTGKFPPTGINGTDLTKEPPVLTGTSAVNLVSTLAPGFQGYMFAQCNFQLAHGFAFISDLGARNLAMGYLALVVPNNITLFRPNAPPAEVLAH